MAELHCIVVTPETTVLDEQIDYLVLPLFDGEIGVAPLHGPMIGRLGCGEMRIRQGERTTRYYVDGGFAEVAGDSVSVLTNHALLAEELDSKELEEHLESVLAKEAHSEQALILREKAAVQARAKLAVARRSTS
ncbi:MAG: ATP synthase F1 subunit epsilon [Planctomycetales bacterium]